MRLSRNLCLGGRFNGRIIKGIKYRGYYIYPNTYSDYNIYIVEIPRDETSIIFEYPYNSTRRTTETRTPYYDFGDGVKNPELEDRVIGNKNYVAYTYEKAGIYQITTTEFIATPGYSNYLKTIIALRSDLIDASSLFRSSQDLVAFENLQLEALEGITTMDGMFFDCINLQTVTFANSSFPNLTNMRNMFKNCDSLKTVDFSHCDLSNVSDIKYMFDLCLSLETVNLSHCDLSGLTNLESAFYGDPIKNFDFTEATFGSVTNMLSTFAENNSLIEIDLSMLDTSQATTVSGLFQNCTALESVNLSNFDLTNVGTAYCGNMFSGCTSLHTLILDNCSKDTINKIIYSSNFPKGELEGITRTIHCREEDVAGLTPPTGWRFEPIVEPEEPPVEPDEPIEPPVEPEEPTIPLYQSGQFRGDTTLTEVRTMVNSTHTYLNSMFSGCTNLVSVNTEDWDTSNVTSMENMFYNCQSLISLDLSNWKTIQATDDGNMMWMFHGCYSLKELDLSNWKLTYESDLHYAFYNCTSLHTLKLDNCDNVTIRLIINSSGFPTNTIEGVTRKIRVKQENVDILTAPSGWEFEYVD